jgi:hypothetical protein
MLRDKKILLGVTGSIAAYKSAVLTRLLVKAGATVKVVITSSAADFITPLTLSTLSKNPVLTDFVKDETGQWNNHVDLGLWADVMIIAPASANTVAKWRMAYAIIFCWPFISPHAARYILLLQWILICFNIRQRKQIFKNLKASVIYLSMQDMVN